jgi:nitrate/nitrite transporter NarK
MSQMGIKAFRNSLLDASLFFGPILLVGGLAGLCAGGWLSDRFGQTKHSSYATIPAIAFLATVPFYLVGILALFLLTSRWLQRDGEE